MPGCVARLRRIMRVPLVTQVDACGRGETPTLVDESSARLRNVGITFRIHLEGRMRDPRAPTQGKSGILTLKPGSRWGDRRLGIPDDVDIAGACCP